MATPNNKDTIYVDIDDEITGIIDKVRTSESRLVALVLPKRASVLQSVVNMKLLKRTADTAKKQVVLITSEKGLLPLAGSVGMYVASTLQSKPSIPVAADDDDLDIDSDEAVDLDESFDPRKAANLPVGALAGDEPAEVNEEAVTIDMEDDEDADTTPLRRSGRPVPGTAPVAAAAAAGVGSAAASPKAKGKGGKSEKNLAVPNFHRFRALLIVGLLALVLLAIGGYYALVVMPTATITAVTDTSTIRTSRTLNLSADQKALDTADGIVPASVQQVQKTSSQQAPASGTKNTGERAHGSATIANCTDNPVTVNAGSGLSANGLTYITQQPLNLPGGNFDRSGNCRTSGSHIGSVNVIAQSAGANYNIENGTKLTLASAPDGSYASSDMRAAANGTIGGGSDNNVKVIAQSDIDAAKQKLGEGDANAAKAELKQKLEAAGFQVIDVTFSTGSPSVTTTGNAGDQADNVSVTQTITYSMFGAKSSDLKKLVTDNVNKQIDTDKQSILDDGLSKATYKLNGAVSDRSAQVDFSAASIAGAKINLDSLKTELAGKKAGEVKSYLTARPGVKDAEVNLSPFWVTKVPSNPEKVTVNFKSADGSAHGQ